MTRHLVIAVALAAALAGCGTTAAATATEPAAMAQSLGSLAGRWTGNIWETASVYYQGQAAVDVRIGDDGRWGGTIGQAKASGVASMRHGWLVLSGTATAPDGHQDVIYYELTGNANKRWGEIDSSFNGHDGQGRVEHATVSLRRAV
jgi:hypothetical protein